MSAGSDIPSLAEALAGRYRIEGEVGRGGMATVYRARDLRHHRTVALKVLRSEVAASLGAERFLSEIRTTANLAHPHILPLFDSGEDAGFLYFVMPFVEGETLRHRLDRAGALPLDEVLRIGVELADALAFAHAQGIVHRDVKPANVLLEADHAVLADFGIARVLKEADDRQLTQAGSPLGTPSYMSPEQAAGDEAVDARADQYALGCVLYEMLSGRPPFEGGVQSVMRQHVAVEPEPLDRRVPGVPVVVASAVGRTLAKDPDARFPEAGALRDALVEAGAPAPPSIHDRPLWQVVGVAGLIGLVVFAVATALMDPLGLPDWTKAWIGGICLVTVPLIGIAEVLQRRRGWSSGGPLGRWLARPMVGWAAGIAIALVGITTVVVTVARAAGIGVYLAAGDTARILMGNVRAAEADSGLATVAHLLLENDLEDARQVRLVTGDELTETRITMRVPEDAPLTDSLGREAAVRLGALYLSGELLRVGSSLQLIVALEDPEEAETLVSVGGRAGTGDLFLDDVDRLAKEFRAKLGGESLTSVRNRTPLPEVTTSSLEALKLYARAMEIEANLNLTCWRADFEECDPWRARREMRPLLQEAVRLDPEFASACFWLGQTFNEPDSARYYWSRAFEVRDRLREREQLLMTGLYQVNFGRYEEAIPPLERVTTNYGEGWIWLAIAYKRLGHADEWLHAIRADVEKAPGVLNISELGKAAWAAGDTAGVLEAIRLAEERQIQHTIVADWKAALAMARLDYAGARQIYEDALIRARDEGRLFPDASMFQVDLFAHELLLGRLDAFRRGLREWLEERGRDWQWYDWQNAQWAAPVYFLLPTDENRIRLGEKMQGYMEAKPVQSRRILWVARLLAYAGRPEDARLHLETWIADDSLRLRTAQGPIREARGHILVEEGKIEEGLALFREKTDSLGCGRNCWGELGWLYDHHGYDGETFEAYRAYLRAPPSLNGSDIVYLPRIHERLGQLYEERGDLNRAEHHHEQFVRLWEDADPIFQPRVQAAREALARVRAQLKDRISHRTPGTEIVHG